MPGIWTPCHALPEGRGKKIVSLWQHIVSTVCNRQNILEQVALALVTRQKILTCPSKPKPTPPGTSCAWRKPFLVWLTSQKKIKVFLRHNMSRYVHHRHQIHRCCVLEETQNGWISKIWLVKLRVSSRCTLCVNLVVNGHTQQKP